MPQSMFDKIWDAHEVADGLLYIDLHLVHEVTSPQAFTELRQRGLKVRVPVVVRCEVVGWRWEVGPPGHQPASGVRRERAVAPPRDRPPPPDADSPPSGSRPFEGESSEGPNSSSASSCWS